MLNLFRMGLAPSLAKSFSPVTSTNVEISPKNFLVFSFSPFATQVLIFKAIPSASSKLLNLNQDQSSKKVVFLVKSLYNWGYDNFTHRNAIEMKLCLRDRIWFKSRDNLFLVRKWPRK